MDSQYSDEVDLLDSLVEFHPEWIDNLSGEAVDLLDRYYGFRSRPSDLAAWRARHVKSDSALQEKAQAVLREFPGLNAN